MFSLNTWVKDYTIMLHACNSHPTIHTFDSKYLTVSSYAYADGPHTGYHW